MYRTSIQLIGRAVAACAVASMALGGVVRAEAQTELINPLPIQRSMSVSDAPAVVEPLAGGTATANFVIHLNGTPLRGNETVRFSFKTEDVSASAGVDYTAGSGALQFVAGGPTALAVGIPVLHDGAADSQLTEKFNLRIGHVIGAVLVDGVGVGSIKDRDAGDPGPPPPPPPPPCPLDFQIGDDGQPVAQAKCPDTPVAQ